MDVSRITIRPLLAYYFGATPLFFLLDVAWDVSVRASFFEGLGPRVAYYAFCLLCGLLARLRPARAPLVALGESAVSITLLVVTFMLPILTLPDTLLADPYATVDPPGPERIINFILAAGVAWWSFQRWSGTVGPRATGGE
jgi:hypothetical protein